MYQKKTTLQTAQIVVEGATDSNLKNRYGTSVNEYMAHEQSKIIREKINQLRNEFAKIGKSKTSQITFDELTTFFHDNNVTTYYIIISNIAK